MANARILIIDDDVDFRSSVAFVLEAEGYEVVTAESGRDGLKKIEEVAPDAVILDVMMESSTEGYAVSSYIKFRQYHGLDEIPVIMVSSIESSPDELYPRSEEVGAIRPDFYLTKPLDIPRFLDVVKKITARKAGV